MFLPAQSVQKEKHRKYLQSHKVTQKEHLSKTKEITDVIPCKERDVSTSRGIHKQNASA